MRTKSKRIIATTFFVLVFINTAYAQQNYKFKFSCHYNEGRTIKYSHWMDERVSNTVTIGDEIARSCDRVDLQLLPLQGGAHFDQNNDQARERTILWREWTPIRESNSNQPITWTSLEEMHPNSVDTNWIIREGRDRRAFSWREVWPNNYWFVKYYAEGQEDDPLPKRFRVRVEYRDGSGHLHEFFAVPWAQKADPHN